MARIILGIIVGFVVWSILWVGSDQLMIVTMGWYRDNQTAFRNAFLNGAPYEANTTALLLNLVRAVLVSLIAGYITALIAPNSNRSTLVLGVLLLLFGLMVEIVAWHYLPIWYHVIFLFLLIPMTEVGGRLRKNTA